MSYIPSFLIADPILGDVNMVATATGDYAIAPAVFTDYSYVHLIGVRDSNSGSTLPIRSSFPTVELISSVKVTVTREDHNGDTMDVDFQIFQIRPMFLRQPIQRGTITIAAGQPSGTVTGLIAVGSKAYIVPCGWRANSGADYSVGDYSYKMSMPLTTSIKAELYGGNVAPVAITIPYQIIDPK